MCRPGSEQRCVAPRCQRSVCAVCASANTFHAHALHAGPATSGQNAARPEGVLRGGEAAPVHKPLVSPGATGGAARYPWAPAGCSPWAVVEAAPAWVLCVARELGTLRTDC
eukprot:11464442-Alexandrium_andersonii.AAC.1